MRPISHFSSRFEIFVILTVLGCGQNVAVDGPPAGNPHGSCPVPAAAAPEDTSRPDRVVGDGSSESCNSEAFLDAIARGGVITFSCGPEPVTITLDRTAELPSQTSKIILDGGGKVALSGGGKLRILKMDACDQSQPSTGFNCQAEMPRLVVQNLTFADGSTEGQSASGGAAIYMNGGKLKVVNCRFFRNRSNYAEMSGGGAIRVLNQYGSVPNYLVNSTFGGSEKFENLGLFGGAVHSAGGAMMILNSLFSHNQAFAASGGLGGAVYSQNAESLSLCGVDLSDNRANGLGGALYFSSTPGSQFRITDSSLRNNQDQTSVTPNPRELYPGLYVDAEEIIVQSSSFE